MFRSPPKYVKCSGIYLTRPYFLLFSTFYILPFTIIFIYNSTYGKACPIIMCIFTFYYLIDSINIINYKWDFTSQSFTVIQIQYY